MVNFKFIMNLSRKEIEYFEKFSRLKFNTFSKTDAFLNDRCVPFQDDGKEITIKERKDNYYVDPNQKCNVGREMISHAEFNTETRKIECDYK